MSSTSALADLVYSVWAIQPERLLELQAIYAAHVGGQVADIKAIEARLGRPLANEQSASYRRVNGVALLDVQGVISPKANMFTQISGGTSAQIFAQSVSAAAEDPDVVGGILVMDTPGGNVLGIPAARDAVRRFAARKPIVTHSDGCLASAGYWIGAAANRVYVADSMVQVGSIGVVYTHSESSEAERQAGVKKTVFTAGKYKRVEGPDGKLNAEGFATLQEKADYIYSVFVGSVAEDLGVQIATVLGSMADGRIFIGQQGIDAGLVDGMVSLNALIAQMASNPGQFANRRIARIKGEKAMSTTTTPRAANSSSSTAPDPAVVRLTKQEMAAKATAYAKEHGTDFVSALRALRLNPAESAEAHTQAEANSGGDRQVQLDQCKAYLQQHGGSIVDAYKALGFDK